MNTILIPTSQNIELEYPVANIGDRIAAAAIDLLILFSYWALLTWLLTRFYESDFWERAFSMEEMNESIQTIALLVMLPAIFYSLLCETLMDGQTIGKLLLKTRTIRLDGGTPGISQYAIRWIVRLIDVWLVGFFPGLIGLITIGVSKKGQRLGDIFASTTVIKLKLVTDFMDTIYVDTGDTYELVFPEISQLKDRDVRILKEVLDVAIRSQNPALMAKLATKIKTVIGIESELDARSLLETVLRDYNHYYGAQ